MRFAPQRRPRFPHLTFQKCSKHKVFWHVLLRNAFRATTACNFSFLTCPNVSAPAALASLLFESFRPSGATKHRKNSVSRLSCLFERLHLLSSDFLHLWCSPSLILPSDFFHAWVSSCLCFSSVHIVASASAKNFRRSNKMSQHEHTDSQKTRRIYVKWRNRKRRSYRMPGYMLENVRNRMPKEKPDTMSEHMARGKTECQNISKWNARKN